MKLAFTQGRSHAEKALGLLGPVQGSLKPAAYQDNLYNPVPLILWQEFGAELHMDAGLMGCTNF